MPTVKHVADLAGVNASTVSRYLSGKLSVTPETEERILQAIKKTNYQPNIIAQSLRSGTSKTIAVVAPDIYQPGISGIIYGLDNRIRETEYLLMIIMTQNSASRELEILRTLSHMMVAGVVIIGQPTEEVNSAEATREALGGHTPLLFVSRNFEESNVLEICPDQVTGVMQITNHLIERGYRSIGLIVGKREHPDAIKKIEGYKRGLSSMGITAKDEMVRDGFYQPEKTQAAVEDLLKKNVDAIICASDLMAITAIKYIQDKGLAIPGDVAVTGYGGTSWADMITPRLTTVDVHMAELGSKVIDHLLNVIDGVSLPSRFQVQSVTLRIGQST